MKALKGKFITIEGIEGVGKSTLINRIKLYLKSKNQNYLITFEPGGTKLGSEIRKILFDTKQKITPIAELFLIFTDRAQHFKEVIQPALEQGKIVISDRFVDSTYAYQGAGRGIELAKIKQLERICYGNFKPDLVLWLDLDVDEAFKRITKRNEPTNRFETEKIAFFYKARNLFIKREKQFNHIHRLDASLDITTLTELAIEKINGINGDWLFCKSCL